jgi:hypothetical protein
MCIVKFVSMMLHLSISMTKTKVIWINTYWSYTSHGTNLNWLASYILLLASKKCFLTSQGLVGAGMNCRAQINGMNDFVELFH